MTIAPGTVLLGTVALEPNRWATVDPSGAPRTIVADWIDAIATAGFDGLELWERHLSADGAVADMLDGPLPITVFNSYLSFDDPDPAAAVTAAAGVASCRSDAVKFNVGPHPDLLDRYAERVAGWLDQLPPAAALLCECHAGTATAEDHRRTARFFDAVGPADRVQAIVHTHESTDEVRARFHAYGDRITHVHVNYLDLSTLDAPPLIERRADLSTKAHVLADLGFAGSWTVEFVHGLLTDRDEPGPLLEQATADLTILREVLGDAFG